MLYLMDFFGDACVILMGKMLTIESNTSGAFFWQGRAGSPYSFEVTQCSNTRV